jgi:hypothetical protein
VGKASVRIVLKQLLFSFLNSGKSLSRAISHGEEMAGFLLKTRIKPHESLRRHPLLQRNEGFLKCSALAQLRTFRFG